MANDHNVTKGCDEGTEPGPAKEKGLPPGKKLGLLLIAWSAAAVVTFPGVVVAPLLFPIGLLRFFTTAPVREPASQFFLVDGWLMYLGLSAAACLTRRQRVYLILYVTLCFLLALNVVGCRIVFSGLAGVG